MIKLILSDYMPFSQLVCCIWLCIYKNKTYHHKNQNTAEVPLCLKQKENMGVLDKYSIKPPHEHFFIIVLIETHLKALSIEAMTAVLEFTEFSWISEVGF